MPHHMTAVDFTIARVADDWEALFAGQQLVFQGHKVRIEDLTTAAQGAPMYITELYTEATWEWLEDLGGLPNDMTLDGLRAKIAELS